MCLGGSFCCFFRSYFSLSLPKKQTHTFANSHNTVMTCHHISASELHSRQLKWQQQATERSGDNHAHTLIQLRLGSLFPNIRAIVHLLAMLPVTTCSAERSFSTLKANQVFVPITHDNYSTDWIDTADYPPKHSHRCFGSDRQVLQAPGINAQFHSTRLQC